MALKSIFSTAVFRKFHLNFKKINDQRSVIMILADISTFLSNQNHFTQLKMFLKIKKNSNLQDLSLEFKDEISPTEKYHTVSSQILQLSRQQLEAKEQNGKGKVQPYQRSGCDSGSATNKLYDFEQVSSPLCALAYSFLNGRGP